MKWAKTVAIGMILLGTLAISINILFGYNTITFITKIREPNSGIWYYQYNFKNYIDNLMLSINDTADLQLQLPTRTWISNGEIFNMLSNNLALMLDWLIFLINILIYPIRIGAYVVKQALAIIGVNVINPPQTGIRWLIDLINLLQPLNIPYV